MRQEIVQIHKGISNLNHEKLVWDLLKKRAIEAPNCIIESTGALYRLRELWIPELANRGIYTVLFYASQEERDKRIKGRERKEIPGYDIDEQYASRIEEEAFRYIPFNISIDTTNMKYFNEAYREIGKYIERAKVLFESINEVHSIGINTLKKGERE